MFKAFKFQQTAVENLLSAFKDLWYGQERFKNLVFKAPTGSGKTYVASQLIQEIEGAPDIQGEISYLWVTFSDESAMQSRNKFKDYLGSTRSQNLLTVEDFNNGILAKGDILFLNWQKLVSKKASDRKLRRPDDGSPLKEAGFYFEDVIANTVKKGREIVLTIDESHTHLSPLAWEKVVSVINPKLIFSISATPKNIPSAEEVENGSARFVRVSHEDVVEQGLIKSSVMVQSSDDIERHSGKDLDELLIDLAIEKKKELDLEYARLKKDVNPLVLIQLPNDDKNLKDIGESTKEELVLKYLIEKGVDVAREVGMWFDNKKNNLEGIALNNSKVNFLLFKQAAGTGWDCPRAHVLVMYREINSATFYTQTVGRIIRMPEPHLAEEYFKSSLLRNGYLYTNYQRDEVKVEEEAPYDAVYYKSSRRSDVNQLEELQSQYKPREEYRDLGKAAEFQSSLQESFTKYFGYSGSEAPSVGPLKAKGIDCQDSVTRKLIVDSAFTDIDDALSQIGTFNEESDYQLSKNDVERLFNFYCYRILAEQTQRETKVGNVSRSWSPLKSALRAWSKKYTGLSHHHFYQVFIKDLLKGPSSVFRDAITRCLIDYYPAKEAYFAARKGKASQVEELEFFIRDEYVYGKEFGLLDGETSTNLSALQPFYLRQAYNGRKNEVDFIAFLEGLSEKVDWWFKNLDSGKDAFGVSYRRDNDGEISIFYPDWIVKFKDGSVGIFDTKSGITEQAENGRANGLASRLRALNYKALNFLWGGIAIPRNGQWVVNCDLEYLKGDVNSYSYTHNGTGEDDNWRVLQSLILN